MTRGRKTKGEHRQGEEKDTEADSKRTRGDGKKHPLEGEKRKGKLVVSTKAPRGSGYAAINAELARFSFGRKTKRRRRLEAALSNQECTNAKQLVSFHDESCMSQQNFTSNIMD